MCGICGYALRAGGVKPDARTIDDMVNVLLHRGPDGTGQYSGSMVAFGHTRLSIIDIDGGAQPMQTADGSLVLTFNGEIYNYKELRQDLIARGHEFATESDTEVILHMYREFGDEFLTHLNGMFAIGIWDEDRKRLLLARDRMGEKPLYYAIVAQQLVFASELKALRQVPGIDLELDMQSVDDYLSFGYVPSPKTIYRSVQKLPHAHYLIWDDGELDVKRYWSAESELQIGSLQEAEEQFRALLDDSIRIRLRSDVPVGAFLSGGTDSTLIVARASEMYPGTMQTFTIGFSEDEFDESGDAAFTADLFSTQHTIRNVEGISLDILPLLVRQFDEPFADPSAVPTYYVTREAARELKVCLSGDGADELFGGYPQYRMEPFERLLLGLPRSARKAVLGIPATLLPDHVRGKGWLNRMIEDGARRYQQKIGVFTAAERARLLKPEFRDLVDFDATLLEPFFERADCELRNRQSADRETYLPDDILVKVDRNSMAHSLEVRTPYLDHRLVEFAAALPGRFKVDGDEQKVLLRRTLRSLVPPEVLQRPKRGFAMPIRDWFRGEHRGFVAERLLDGESRIFRFLEPRSVARLVADHDRGQRDFGDRIWSLIWFEEWLRNFG